MKVKKARNDVYDVDHRTRDHIMIFSTSLQSECTRIVCSCCKGNSHIITEEVHDELYLLNMAYVCGLKEVIMAEDIVREMELMAVPAMSTRPWTSALRMPSTHPTIRNANHR